MGIKYQINESFFGTWNSKMSYVLGYLYADGSLDDLPHIRGKYIKVTSIDKITIKRIKKWLDSKHKITTLFSLPTSNRKDRYVLRIGSHKLYNTLVKHGLYPNKSLTVEFPFVPRAYLKDFVRGYFDGDGCVHIEMAKGKLQKKIIKRLVVVFTSGSKKFLNELLNAIQRTTGIKNGRVYISKRSFQLRYTTAGSIELFKFIYENTSQDMFLERKFKKFQQYFKLRPVRVDKGVENILECINGHVVK
jgi:intein/homing endonuclease